MKSLIQYINQKSVVTRILLYGHESFKDEINLLILKVTIDFVLSTNRFGEHFIFSEFRGIFPFIHDHVNCHFIIFEILTFTFSYYFFVSLAPIIVMVPGDCFCLLCKCSFP